VRLARILETAGYKVTTAQDGEEGLEKFGDGKEFDLVITDLSMPRLDGISMTTRIKEISPRIPVILHSAMTLRIEDMTPGLFMGVLYKPCAMQLVIDMVDLLARG